LTGARCLITCSNCACSIGAITHVNISNTNTGVSDDPLVKVLGLGVGNAVLKGSVDHALQTSDLVLLGEHGDVVLEGVGDPEALVADVGDSLVDEPVVVLGESLVQAVVEVLVVGEDDMTANIVQEAFRSDIGTGKTTSLMGGVDNQP